MKHNVIDCSCGVKYVSPDNKHCLSYSEDAKYKQACIIFEAIRNAREVLSREEYNKLMGELSSTARVQEDLSHTDEMWEMAQKILSAYKIKG